jgi:MFS family permease
MTALPDPPADPVALPRVLLTLMPVMGVLFVAYLIVGIAMPVLPLHLNLGLGQSAFVVGLVGSMQYITALFSRMWAGVYSDAHGAKQAMILGQAAVILGGAAYLVSLYFAGDPELSVAILMVARALLGVAQSFVVMGSMSWGLALAGPANAGKVLAWMGISLYAAFALGAPIGTFLFDRYGFVAIALATMIAPAAALLLILPMKAVPGVPQPRGGFSAVAGAVWLPGVGLALGCVGFGAISTFIALLYVERGWDQVWVAFTTSALAFVAGRITLGHLPDKVGGAKIASVCVLVEAIGQVLIWQAQSPPLALAGIAMTGFGYALVYPGLGVEAIRRAPPQNRGMAMGAFTAFYDLSLAISGPLLGIIAGAAGIASVFFVSALTAVAAAMLAGWLMMRPPKM